VITINQDCSAATLYMCASPRPVHRVRVVDSLHGPPGTRSSRSTARDHACGSCNVVYPKGLAECIVCDGRRNGAKIGYGHFAIQFRGNSNRFKRSTVCISARKTWRECRRPLWMCMYLSLRYMHRDNHCEISGYTMFTGHQQSATRWPRAFCW
jgi:hypothetical protein